MRNMKLKAALFAVFASASISASAANPFSDVDPSSWAYNAVASLSEQGVVDGYPDGMFRGEKNVTRYEMAQIIGKLTAKQDALTAEQRASLSRLSAEYADELSNLGVRVAALEQKTGNTQFITELRFSGMNRYDNLYKDQTASYDGPQSYYENGIRVRLNSISRVNDRSYVYGQVQTYLSMNGKPMYDVNGENDEGQLRMTRLFATYYFGEEGKYDNHPFGPSGDLVVIGQFPVKMGVTGYTYDGTFKGIALKVGDTVQGSQFTLAYGRASDINYAYTAPMMRGISGLTEPIVNDLTGKFKGLVTKEELSAMAESSASVADFGQKLIAAGANATHMSEEAFQQKYGSVLSSMSALGDKFEINNHGGTLYPLAPDVHMAEGADRDVPAVYASYIYKQPNRYEFHMYGMKAVGPVGHIVQAGGFAAAVNLTPMWNLHGEFVKNFRRLPLNDEKPYSYNYGISYGNADVLKPKSFLVGVDYIFSKAGTYFGGSGSDIADQYMGHVYGNWNFLGADMGSMPAYIADKLDGVVAGQGDGHFGGAKFFLAKAQYVPMKGLILEASYGFGAKDMGGRKMDDIFRIQATAFIK